MNDATDLLKDALSDRYAIERELGRGGMATVYLARDLKHDRQVAVKVLHAELAATVGTDRFLREIRIAAQLNHPHILTLIDSGEADGFLYYVMPFVEGESLGDKLSRERELPISEAVRILRDVVDALASAHSQGVIHRDIKPDNVMLSGRHALVTDFGVAKALRGASGFSDVTTAGVALGTPAYMSPEQAAADELVDQRSDIYGVGALAYELLTGRPPFLGTTPQMILSAHMVDTPDPVTKYRSSVPVGLEQLVMRCLEKKAADRWQSAEELLAQLEVLATPSGGLTPTATRPMQVRSPERISELGAPEPAMRWAARRMVAAMGAVALVAVLALAVWKYWPVMADPGLPPPDRPYTVLAAVDGSADSSMRDMVEYLLRFALDTMAHVVQTVPSTEVERLLTLMDRPTTISLDAATARELAERYGVATVVLPRVDVAGGGFVIAVRVEDVVGGHLRAAARREAESPEAVTKAVDEVTRELRHDLGESRAALANMDQMPAVLTPSLEALRAYRDGARAHALYRWEEAAALYQEALTFDPAFAEARRSLAVMHANRGFIDSALVQFRRALETPERLRDSRRRDAESQIRWLSDFALWDGSMFRTGHTNNDAWSLFWLGYVDSAATLYNSLLRNIVRDARRFDPERALDIGEMAWFWSNASNFAVFSGRHAELEALRDSLRVDPVPWWDFKLSVASAEWDRADSLLEANPNLRWSPMHRAILGIARGRIRESHQLALYNGCAFVCEMVYGVPDTDTVRALAGRGFPQVRSYAWHGVHAALAGDSIEVKRVLARFRTARDSATSELFEHAYEPLFAFLEAELAKQRGDWGAAAQRLAPTVRKLGQPGYGLILWWDEHLWWVLADVYAHLGHPDSAMVQLEAIVERPPRWAYSAAHLKLGQLYSQVGNTTEALDHFTTFLDTFTDPDPEYVWMVEEARAGVERLGGGR